MFFKKRKKLSITDRIIVKENSLSSDVEGYNRLKDNVLYLNADGNNKVLQIESSISHECKTTVASNLAVSLGYTDKKVLVVDLDFRKPRIQQAFGVSIDLGLTDYLLGKADKTQIIKQTKYPNVSVVTRGQKIYNSSLVLVSEKFKEFIAEVREEYDYVILDCAPILQVSDYIHISKVSDGVIFLVAYGITTKGQVNDAVRELQKNNIKILGSVFTLYDRKKDIGYSYGYYGKGYYGYYKSYLEDNKPDEVDEKVDTK